MSTRRLRSRADLNSHSASSKAAPSAPSMSRPRRAAAAAASTTTSSATIQRLPDDRRLSMQLTVKAPPEKLREATSRASRSSGGRDSFRNVEIMTGPRSSRSKKKVVESSTESEEEEEDDDDDAEGEDDDAEGEEDEDQEMDDDDDEDAEGEEDEEMEDAPPPPPQVPSSRYQSSARSAPKPSVKVTPADMVQPKGTGLADDQSDDELSDLSEEEDDELGDEDAEGEELDDDDAEGEDDSDDTPGSISRSNTPDVTKLTRRQRKAYEEYDGGLMALSNEAQKKKHLTAEEHAMRRAEMARRRKNLSEKRNEEEKMDTINRLLKKQAPKRRGRAAAATLDAVAESGAEEEQEPERAPAIYVRYIQTPEGVSLAIPEEWLEAPVGEIFTTKASVQNSRNMPAKWGGRMVEEVA